MLVCAASDQLLKLVDRKNNPLFRIGHDESTLSLVKVSSSERYRIVFLANRVDDAMRKSTLPTLVLF